MKRRQISLDTSLDWLIINDLIEHFLRARETLPPTGSDSIPVN